MRLDELQKKIDAEHPNNDIFILGVNEAGLGNNEAMTEGSDLPWLLDTEEADWWGTWEAAYRDVVILDREGAEAEVFNLTEHDLQDPEEFAALEALLLEVAEQQ